MSDEYKISVEGSIRGEEFFPLDDDTHKTIEDIFAEFENTTKLVRIEITELDPSECPPKEYHE